MSATIWIVLLGCIVFNVLSGYFFIEENATKEENGTESKCSRSAKVYMLISIVLNIAIALLILFYHKQNSVVFALKRIALLSIMWPLGYIDYKTYRIPNRFIVLGIAYRVVILLIELVARDEYLLGTLLSEGISAIALLVAAILCSLFVKNSIGFGDMKLFIVMGILLGLESIWSAIFVSLFITFIVSLVLLALRKKTRKDSLPFAPLLMMGTYISIILTGM